MKNVLLGVNVVLVAAVAYLFYLHFSTPLPDLSNEKKQDAAIAAGTIKIAYFDLDSLQKNYEYFNEVKNELKGHSDNMEAQLAKMRNEYNAKVNDFNKRGNTLSQTESSQLQEQIMQMQQNFGQQQEAMNQQLQNETLDKMLKVKSKIQEYLKTYSSQKGFTYVFATSSDDNIIYYKDSVRDITNDLVKLLNDKYRETKKK